MLSILVFPKTLIATRLYFAMPISVGVGFLGFCLLFLGILYFVFVVYPRLGLFVDFQEEVKSKQAEKRTGASKSAVSDPTERN